MQMYIVIVSGSILNVSTVHFNGHLTPHMMLSTETCIRGTPCIKQDTTAFPEDFTVLG